MHYFLIRTSLVPKISKGLFTSTAVEAYHAAAPVKYNSVIGPGTAWIKRIMWSPLANFHNWAV